MAPVTHLVADWTLLQEGFAPDLRIAIDGGIIASIAPDDGQPGERVAGALLPGMTDLHSHAFQRSFAGRAEFSGGGTDFWSWREAMYHAADRIEPETLAPIMAWLGMRKLLGGITTTVEFHYLHHGRGGVPYADRCAMAHALVAGARQAGIGMTLLFGLYEAAGFAGVPLEAGQLRFRNSAEQALGMMSSMHEAPDLRLGLAPHSLRAVAPGALREAAEGLAAIDGTAPIHIHVAEQTAEVAACRAALGAPPVAWLLDHAPVGPNWCLIHATHTDAGERAGMAHAGAVAGLCPSTEGNLGDGIFGLQDFAAEGGRFGIGADSNVCLDAFAELRLLEYAQRLTLRRRNVLAGADGHTGRILWQKAASGGARAAARPVGHIAVGQRADFVVIGPTEETAADAPDFWLDAAIFAGDASPALHVMTAGDWIVRDGVHVRQAEIEHAYRTALAALR